MGLVMANRSINVTPVRNNFQEEIGLKYIQNQGEPKRNYKMLYKNQLSIVFG